MQVKAKDTSVVATPWRTKACLATRSGSLLRPFTLKSAKRVDAPRSPMTTLMHISRQPGLCDQIKRVM